MTENHSKIHREAFLADLHCDTMILMRRGYDISKRHTEFHVDIPRLTDGGVNLVVFASLSPLDKAFEPFETVTDAVKFLNKQFDARSDKIEICRSADDAERIHDDGKISALLSIEGGNCLNGSPESLAHFHDLGVRLITIAHSIPTGWCSHCYEKDTPFDGLSETGVEIIKEMNRLGMIVDLSHSSDDTFDAVMETSSAPVIASHSNARALCPSPRNLTDKQIVRIAERGGMVGVTFVSMFLETSFYRAADDGWSAIPEDIRREYDNITTNAIPEDEVKRRLAELEKYFGPPGEKLEKIRPPLSVVVDHIDHMVKLTGVDHVGLGSDFDGMAFPPHGLDDCSGFPGITAELINRGYRDDDIRKILGGNFLRIFREICG